MRSEKRNGGATVSRPRTIYIRGSALRPRRCGASQADANPDFQFQKVGLAKASGAQECQRRSKGGLGGTASVPSQNWDETELVPPSADLPSATKRERARKREQTSRSCIAR